MSDQTRADIAAAIQAHIQDENSEALILTDWTLAAASVGQEADTTLYTYVGSNSPAHVHTGLAAALSARHAWPVSDWDDDDE